MLLKDCKKSGQTNHSFLWCSHIYFQMYFCMNPLFQPVLPLAAHLTFSAFFKLWNNNIYASDSQSCTSIQFLRNICRWLWELYCFGMSQLSHGCFFAILIFESDSNHWVPPSPSTNSKAGPCRESWEIIEGNPLNLQIAEKFNLILWKCLSYFVAPGGRGAPMWVMRGSGDP